MSGTAGMVLPGGSLGFTVIRAPRTAVPARELTLREILHYGFSIGHLDDEVRSWRLANLRHLWRGMKRVLAARTLHLAHFYGQLSIVVIRGNGQWLDYGLASMRVVTDTGVGFIVDSFQNLTELENMKFHGLGTGGTAEAATQTALVTELTTAYNPDNTRATGTTAEAA